MKANHIPTEERLYNRICKLSYKIDSLHGRSNIKGNPYWRCLDCGLHDPEISISGHGKNCSVPGLEKQLLYYERLYKEIKNNNLP